MVRGWSTEERRSSVRSGARVRMALRWLVVCLGSRRRRRSLCQGEALGLGIGLGEREGGSRGRREGLTAPSRRGLGPF